jgi:competence protein ComEC
MSIPTNLDDRATIIRRIEWQRMPVLPILCVFALGIGTMAFLPCVYPVAIGVLGVSLSAMWLWVLLRLTRWRDGFGILAAFAVWSLGVCVTAWHDERRAPTYFAQYLPARNIADTSRNAWKSEFTPNYAVATVEKRRNRHERVYLTLQLQSIKSDCNDTLRQCTGRVLLTVADTLAATFQVGDVLAFAAPIRATTAPHNPEAFDYGRYLHFQNIHYTAYAAHADALRWIQNAPMQWSWRRIAEAARTRLVSRLHRLLPQADEWSVAAALLVGYDDAISDDLREAYMQTGSTHILAVSGTHVGLVYAALAWLFGFLPKSGSRTRRWGLTVLTLAVVWVFALLTGAGASVLRAAAVFTFLAIAKALRREVSIFNMLSVAGLVLLLQHPFLLFDVGFQLSFAAVLGIVVFYPMWHRRLFVQNRVLRFFLDLTLVSVAAQLATAPLSLYYFHQFPTYFCLSGLVAIPASVVAMYAGIGVLILGDVPLLSEVLGQILYYAVWLMNHSVYFVEQLPMSTIKGFSLSAWSVWGLFGVLFCATWSFWSKNIRFALAGMTLIFALSTYRTTQQWQLRQTRQVTIYDAGKRTLLDVFVGEKCFSWSDSVLTTAQLRFCADNYRHRLAVKTISTHTWTDTLHHETIQYTQKYWQLGEKRLLLLDRAPAVALTTPIEVLVLRGSPKVLLGDFLQQHRPRLVVADASNSRYKAQQWQRECAALGIAWHDVRQQGAWIMPF